MRLENIHTELYSLSVWYRQCVSRDIGNWAIHDKKFLLQSTENAYGSEC